jgi:hypothetical protein
MKKEYTRIASVPTDEKIVSTVTLGGHYYWSFKFPFRHYKKPLLYVATQNAIYIIDLIETKADSNPHRE